MVKICVRFYFNYLFDFRKLPLSHQLSSFLTPHSSFLIPHSPPLNSQPLIVSLARLARQETLNSKLYTLVLRVLMMVW